MTTYELLCFYQSSIYISPHLWCWAQATKDLGIRFFQLQNTYTLWCHIPEYELIRHTIYSPTIDSLHEQGRPFFHLIQPLLLQQFDWKPTFVWWKWILKDHTAHYIASTTLWGGNNYIGTLEMNTHLLNITLCDQNLPKLPKPTATQVRFIVSQYQPQPQY